MKKSNHSKRAKLGSHFFDRENKQIESGDWALKMGNRDYYMVREYENDKISIRVMWEGKDPEIRRVLDQWRIFKVAIFNVIIKGDRPGTFFKKLIEDPTYTKRFITETEAVDYYQETLIKFGYAETSVDEYLDAEEFVEIGNKLSKGDTELKTVAIKTKSSIAGSW
ncbi:MAG: hypothetical protein IBX56_20060 [Methylomicrobium sp.]|nr:hypothetical protein [Methylomicrobium sp.]